MISLRFLLPGALLFGATALLADDTSRAADSRAPSPTPAPQMGEGHHQEMHLRRIDEGPKELETVTFLGVETAPVSKALIAQLGLPHSAGLVVEHVVSNTPASEALKQYDILLKLDDQILIDQHQLSVLIRSHSPGDEVTVTYIRGGKTGTAKVKLGKHEMPKFSSLPLVEPFEFNGDDESLGAADKHEHVQRMLSMIDRAHHGEPVRIEIEHGKKGEGMRAVRLNTANSNLVYTDDDGSLELTIKDGKKTLVAKDAKGNPQFAGPATTDEERKRIPDRIRARLDKLESMHNVSFRADGEFEELDTEVAQPDGKGVQFLQPRPADVRVLTM